MSNEPCARCGDIGPDRRTLWMACLYAMEETGVPFETAVLFHADLDEARISRDPVSLASLGMDLRGARDVVIEPARITTTGELTPHHFYTLRVCKQCRGDWMAAIQEWFQTKPQQESWEDVGEPAPSPETPTTATQSREGGAL